ncbi:uncharacterized protein LOC127010815 [Drosophila biarmipes]|uniref:uncharacterized protein LOC127010815 n=1 Tax=Drosophila biarmipes TaxID=125945 RepID=UPI0021CCF08E|nr:uncharacterized protein LOC127010815 [Drosophila biarmipes]
MSTHNSFSVLVFLFFVLTTAAEINRDLVRCGDCTAANVGKCTIENDTGYYVSLGYVEVPYVRTKQSDVPRGTSDLSECIPGNMKIEADDGLFSYICVWSPELGCQIIYPKHNEKPRCFNCRTRDLGLGEDSCMFKRPKRKQIRDQVDSSPACCIL